MKWRFKFEEKGDSLVAWARSEDGKIGTAMFKSDDHVECIESVLSTIRDYEVKGHAETETARIVAGKNTLVDLALEKENEGQLKEPCDGLADHLRRKLKSGGHRGLIKALLEAGANADDIYAALDEDRGVKVARLRPEEEEDEDTHHSP